MWKNEKNLFHFIFKTNFFLRIFIFISLIPFFYFFIISSIFITTENMSPNLKKGDVVLGWHFGYGLPLFFMGQGLKSIFISRGDVISFRFPGDEKQLIVRRIVALPGDRLEIKKGLLFLNKKATDYKFLSEKKFFEKLPGEKDFHVIESDPDMNLNFLVPKDQVFVLSDYRKSRDDSTTWGSVPLKNIESHPDFIWFSVDKKWNPIWSRFFLWVK